MVIILPRQPDGFSFSIMFLVFDLYLWSMHLQYCLSLCSFWNSYVYYKFIHLNCYWYYGVKVFVIWSRMLYMNSFDFPNNFSQSRLLKTPQSIIKYLLTYNRYNSLLILAITSLIMIFSLVFFREVPGRPWKNLWKNDY